MSLLLYINGQLADLEAGQPIAQTKQVNDLNSLDNRQAGYTNKFKLPKTAANTRIMQFLTFTGNTSGIPYQKNVCSLYSDNGECFVYNGWAVITDGGDSYDAVVYDGIIDLYKAIENKALNTVNLDALNHEKTLAAITASWSGTTPLPYRYILGNYNGNTGNTTPTDGSIPQVNIDYLVPAVNVAWLWEQVFLTYNMGYSGAVFETEPFKNLWMTYPKGINTAEAGAVIFKSTQYTNYNQYYTNSDHYWRTLLVRYIVPQTLDTAYIYNLDPAYKLRVKEAGYYKVQITGNVNTNTQVQLLLARNLNYTNNAALDTVSPFYTFITNQPHNEDFDHTSNSIYLNSNDSISVLLRNRKGISDAVRFNSSVKWDSFEVTLTKVSLGDINFSNAFADFSVRDFLTEVVHRFGLTMFKDKYTNNYDFLTLQEQLQGANPVNWSSKFGKKISENYIYGSYAQRNWFKYAYNDKESTYNDGFINVANVNLAESKDVIKSKIYSPENQKATYLGRAGNVYKLWEKEVVENPEEGEAPITYKPLDKRYYFLRSEDRVKNLQLMSDTITAVQTVTNICTESFWKLPYTDIVQDYYGAISQLLDNAMLVTAELWLTDADVVNFDFKKLYYLEQLSAYFIMNKINNYIPGKPTKCELIRVQYIPQPPQVPGITITGVVQFVGATNYGIFFSLNYFTLPEGGILQFQASADGVIWDNIATSASDLSPRPIISGYGGYSRWRMLYEPLGIISNTYSI